MQHQKDNSNSPTRSPAYGTGLGTESGAETNEDGRGRVRSSPETAAEAESEVAPGHEVIDLTLSPPAAAERSSDEQTIAPTPVNTALRSPGAVTTCQPDLYYPLVISSSQPELHEQHRNPAQLPTVDEIEVIDGFGHVRARPPQSQPALESLPPWDAPGAESFETAEAVIARGGAITSLDRSSIYRMPGSDHVGDARQQHPALLDTVSPTWVHQPWQLVEQGEAVAHGALPDEQGVGGDIGQGGRHEGAALPPSGSGTLQPPPADPFGRVGDSQALPQDPMQGPAEHFGDFLEGGRNAFNPEPFFEGHPNWEIRSPVGLPVEPEGSGTFNAPASGTLGRGDGLPFSPLNLPQAVGGAGLGPPEVSNFQPAPPAYPQQPTWFTSEPQHTAQPPRPLQLTHLFQRAAGMQSTDEQLQARITELRGLTRAEIQTHYRILDAIIAAHPEWQNQSDDSRLQQRRRVWARQFATFEREFLQTHNTDRNALAASSKSGRFFDIPLSRQRQLIEVQTRIINNLPQGQLPFGTDIRLRWSVLEGQLNTFQAWSRIWRTWLPAGHPEQTAQGEIGGGGTMARRESVTAAQVSPEELERIAAFGEYMDTP
jgi:hypothetical protein